MTGENLSYTFCHNRKISLVGIGDRRIPVHYFFMTTVDF